MHNRYQSKSLPESKDGRITNLELYMRMGAIIVQRSPVSVFFYGNEYIEDSNVHLATTTYDPHEMAHAICDDLIRQYYADTHPTRQVAAPDRSGKVTRQDMPGRLDCLRVKDVVFIDMHHRPEPKTISLSSVLPGPDNGNVPIIVVGSNFMERITNDEIERSRARRQGIMLPSRIVSHVQQAIWTVEQHYEPVLPIEGQQG